MKAAYITRPGPPQAITFGEIPEPTQRESDVLVAVDCAAVNHVDTFIRSGAYATQLDFPFVVGRDMVGTVLSLGANASNRFCVGQVVWSNSLGYGGRQGTASEVVAVPSDRLYPLPDGVDQQAFVALVHPGAAAFLALYKHGRLRRGETVVVAGGGGNVGRAAIRFAHHAGARVVAIARRRDWATCRSLGADTTVDFDEQTYGAALVSACQGGVDVYVDTSGRLDLDLVTGLLAPRGRIVVMAGLRARPVLPLGAVYVRDAEVKGFAISNAPVADLRHAAGALARIPADDVLYTAQPITELPLSQASRAHLLLESGQTGGRRLVLSARAD